MKSSRKKDFKEKRSLEYCVLVFKCYNSGMHQYNSNKMRNKHLFSYSIAVQSIFNYYIYIMSHRMNIRNIHFAMTSARMENNMDKQCVTDIVVIRANFAVLHSQFQ